MKTMNLICAALLALSSSAWGQTTLTLSTPVEMTMTLTAPVETTMTAEPPAPPRAPVRTLRTWNAIIRGTEGDILRHIQNARDSNSAMFHLETDPNDPDRLAFHSELLIERLLGCIVEAILEKSRGLWLLDDGRDLRGPHSANYVALEAVDYFGDQVSLAWEKEIIAAVVRQKVNSQPAERLANYAALKTTFAPLTIYARGGMPVLTIGDEMPRRMMAGVGVSEMSPKLDAPLVLEFKQFPALLSENDGYLIRVDSPARTTIGGKEIEYSHNNEAIYEVERFSAESGEPNPISTAYVQMGRGESVSISLYESFRDNPTLRPGDVRRTLVGIRTTIARTETDAEAEE